MRILMLLILSTPLSAATWYVRTDGGTATQCTGLADAAYPGSGVAQSCAFSNPYYLWTNDPTPSQAAETAKWKISGGDTVLIGTGDYGMGWRSPSNVAGAWWNYQGCRGNNRMCYAPTIPAGTADRPTRITGVCHQDGPTTILRGRGAVNSPLNLMGAQYVDVECLEITDAAQCRIQTLTGEPYGCAMYDTAGRGDYAYYGVMTDLGTQHVHLRHLNIHGMAHVGITGAVGGDVTAEDVTISANGNMGWNFDPGGQLMSHGPFTFDGGLVEWSGCVEAYPVRYGQPRILWCGDQAGANANGDGLGFVDMDGDLTLRNLTVRYNTQDGVDALYPKSLHSFTLEDSTVQDNIGQILKTAGADITTIRRNVMVSGCERLTQGVEGITAQGFNTSIKGACRGADAIALMFRPGTDTRFEYNSVATYAPTAFDIQCRAMTDWFTAAGRRGWDGKLATDQALTGKVRTYQLTSVPTYIGATGAVWIYPKTGNRYGKRVGLKGATSCYGAPCQFYYDPETNLLVEDPADDPPSADAEMRVDYQSSQACGDTISLSVQNNVVRGWPRPSTGVNGGALWMQTWPTGQAKETWEGNYYCGLRNPVPHAGEIWLDKCPGGWWAKEPMTLGTAADLLLDMTPLSPGSPLIGAAVAIPGYPVSAKDVGAIQTSSASPIPPPTDSPALRFFVDRVPDGSLRVRNAKDALPPGAIQVYVVDVTGTGAVIR